MKDQREKLVWIALALMVIAFAAGNVSMCLIMHAQRAKIDTAKFLPLSSTCTTGRFIVMQGDSIIWFTNQGRIKR